jgi:hypothetical protein
VTFNPFNATYQADLSATGGCIAHFRANGNAFESSPGAVDDSGTLSQVGAIVCGASG